MFSRDRTRGSSERGLPLGTRLRHAGGDSSCVRIWIGDHLPGPTAKPWDLVVLTTALAPDAGGFSAKHVVMPFAGERTFRSQTKEALETARVLASKSPECQGLPLLDLFLTPLADAVLQLIVGLDLFARARSLCGSSPAEIVLEGKSLCCRAFAEAVYAESRWRVHDRVPTRAGFPQGATARLRKVHSLVSSTPLQLLPKELILFIIERYDRQYKVRRSWSALRTHHPPAPGRSWGLSTYENYTNALVAYEAQPGLNAGGRYAYLIGNHSAERVLSKRDHDVWHLWDFSPRRNDLPPFRDLPIVSLSEGDIPLAVGRLLEDVQPMAFLKQPRYVRQFMLELSMLASFFEAASPSCFVTANQYSPLERAGLILARDRGIRTVQFMHGVLEKYYLFDSILSDEFIVTGPFWKDLLPPGERAKCSISSRISACEVDSSGREISDASRCRSESWTDLDASAPIVTWFTGPIGLVPFATTKELAHIAKALLESLLRCPEAAMVVRVHPAEQLGDYHRLIGMTARSLGLSWSELGVRIHFSQRTPIRPLAERSSVAFMYLSTTFTECLAAGVPVISPGWHHFAISETLERCGVFIRPPTLAMLTELIVKGLRGTLSYQPTVSPNEFLS